MMLKNTDQKEAKSTLGKNSKKLLAVLSRESVKPTQPGEQQKPEETEGCGHSNFFFSPFRHMKFKLCFFWSKMDGPALFGLIVDSTPLR